MPSDLSCSGWAERRDRVYASASFCHDLRDDRGTHPPLTNNEAPSGGQRLHFSATATSDGVPLSLDRQYKIRSRRLNGPSACTPSTASTPRRLCVSRATRGLLVEFHAKREHVVAMLIRDTFVEDTERREATRTAREDDRRRSTPKSCRLTLRSACQTQIVAHTRAELLVRARHLDREIDACRMQLARTPSRRLASGRPRGPPCRGSGSGTFARRPRPRPTI